MIMLKLTSTKEAFRFTSKKAFLSYDLKNFDVSMEILFLAIKDIFLDIT
jgi:hypothetical protein